MTCFLWSTNIVGAVIKLVLGLGTAISSAKTLKQSSYHAVNLEEFISNLVSLDCDLVIFNTDPNHFFNFLPFKRPTILFNQGEDHSGHKNGTEQNNNLDGSEREIYSEFKLNLTAECQIIVFFGLHTNKLMSYDDFVGRHFNKIKLILIFPLNLMDDGFYSGEIRRRYPWNHIWHHNTRIIDHITSQVLFATKFTFCKSNDPVCVLPGVSKKFGYKNVSPHLHIQNWGEYDSAGLQYPPIELNPDSPSSILNLVGGLEGQLLKHLVLEYRMTLTLITPDDRAYGVQLVNNTWTGIFGLLQRGQVDFIGGMLAGNWERRSLGSYMSPLYNTKFSLISRKLPKRVSWTAPFTVFSELVWAAVFGSFVVVLLFMISVSKLRSHYFDERFDLCHDPREFPDNSASSLVVQLVMSALKQPSQKTPNGPAALTFTSWSLCLFIVFSVYSSYLTARLSIPDPERNIDTMRDVWETQRTFIVHRGGTVNLYLKTSSDPDTKYVMDHYHRYADTILIGNYTYLQAIDEYKYVISPEIKGFQYKVLAGLDGIKRKLRNYHVAKSPLINVFVSWIASKQLGQREGPAIALAMLRAQDMGLLTKWSTEPLRIGNNRSISTRKMLTAQSKKSDSGNRDHKKKLSIDALKGVFLMWVLGCVVSIAVFVLELIVGNSRFKQKPRPSSRRFDFQYCE